LFEGEVYVPGRRACALNIDIEGKAVPAEMVQRVRAMSFGQNVGSELAADDHEKGKEL
jgi:hypothetical protein